MADNLDAALPLSMRDASGFPSSLTNLSLRLCLISGGAATLNEILWESQRLSARKAAEPRSSFDKRRITPSVPSRTKQKEDGTYARPHEGILGNLSISEFA